MKNLALYFSSLIGIVDSGLNLLECGTIFVVIFATVKLCINPVLLLELLECLKVLNCLSLFLLVSLTSLSDATHKVKAMVRVSRLVLSLCYLMDCRSSDSSVHGILQARILEWVAIPFSRGSS